jgi:hypothetical protein
LHRNSLGGSHGEFRPQILNEILLDQVARANFVSARLSNHDVFLRRIGLPKAGLIFRERKAEKSPGG